MKEIEKKYINATNDIEVFNVDKDIIANINITGSQDNEFYLDHMVNTCEKIGAHRSDYYAICFLKSGEMRVETNLLMNEVQAPALFVIAPDVIRHFYHTKEGNLLTVLFFKKEFFLETQSDIYLLDKYDFFEMKDQHIIKLKEDEVDTFANYFELIEKKIQDYKSHTPDIVRNFINILISEIDELRASRQVSREVETTINRNEAILIEFKNLLARYFRDQRQLSFYAEKMHISPKHLSTTIKSVSGKSASEWIREMILLESKVLLHDPERTISGIAQSLGFTDPSHFNRFFKNHTGQNPQDYRNI